MELPHNELELELLDPDPLLESNPQLESDLNDHICLYKSTHLYQFLLEKSSQVAVCIGFITGFGSKNGIGSMMKGVRIGIGIANCSKNALIPNPDPNPAVELQQL